jgi:TolB protein
VPAAGFHGEPNYSPDGTRIAFDSDMGNHPAGEGIYAMNASDGENVVRVTSNQTGGFDGSPKWSPDGKRIAFIRYAALPNGSLLTAVFIVNTNGTSLRQITNYSLNAQDPDWSPDGSWIAFDAREYAPTGSQIWLVHANGVGLHRLTSLGSKSNLYGPVFSPDGKLILVYGYVGQKAGLWTMKTDGTHLTLLGVSTPPALAFADWGTAPPQ